MVIHHIFNEEDSSRFCPYCRADIPEKMWNSSFTAQSHYKSTQCTCGRHLTIKVAFHGSGHDTWNNGQPTQVSKGAMIKERKEKGTIRTIEDQIKVLEEKKGQHS